MKRLSVCSSYSLPWLDEWHCEFIFVFMFCMIHVHVRMSTFFPVFLPADICLIFGMVQYALFFLDSTIVRMLNHWPEHVTFTVLVCTCWWGDCDFLFFILWFHFALHWIYFINYIGTQFTHLRPVSIVSIAWSEELSAERCLHSTVTECTGRKTTCTLTIDSVLINVALLCWTLWVTQYVNPHPYIHVQV